MKPNRIRQDLFPGAVGALVAGATMLGPGMGLRQTHGLFLEPMTGAIAIRHSGFDLAIAAHRSRQRMHGDVLLYCDPPRPERLPMSDTASPPVAVVLLGYGGLLPFLATAIGTTLPVSWAPPAAFGFMAYSAAMLAFLGGLQWGIALHPHADRFVERLVVGVLPVLAAALAVPIGVRWGALLLLAGYVLFLAWDMPRNRGLMPGWYVPLRIRLTAGVAICHLIFLGHYVLG